MGYAPWVDRVYKQKTPERLAALERLLSSFASLGEKADQLAMALADLKEFEKPSFLTHLHVIPLEGSSKDGSVEVINFPEPILAVKHKKLPVVMGVAKKKIPVRGKRESQEGLEKNYDIKQALSWSGVVARMAPAEKKELARLLISGLVDQRKRKAEGEEWLSDLISKEKELRIVGFALNAPYINVDKSYGDTRPIWVHPWGIPALLLRHRTLPVIMMVSPAIRLNENLMGSRNMEGYTG